MNAPSSARDRAIELIEGELIESDEVRGSIRGAAGHALDALLDHPGVLLDLLAEVDAREAAETVRDAWRGR